MDTLAREQSEKTGEDFQQWLTVIEWAAETSTVAELTDGEFVTLVKNSPSVSNYKLIVEWFETHRETKQESASGFDMLVGFVDRSDHTLIDWVKALNSFKAWIQEKGIDASFERALGFIQCCTQTTTSGQGELSSVVEDNLNQHGLQ